MTDSSCGRCAWSGQRSPAALLGPEALDLASTVHLASSRTPRPKRRPGAGLAERAGQVAEAVQAAAQPITESDERAWALAHLATALTGAGVTVRARYSIAQAWAVGHWWVPLSAAGSLAPAVLLALCADRLARPGTPAERCAVGRARPHLESQPRGDGEASADRHSWVVHSMVKERPWSAGSRLSDSLRAPPWCWAS
jgi:hypothetical protein